MLATTTWDKWRRCQRLFLPTNFKHVHCEISNCPTSATASNYFRFHLQPSYIWSRKVISMKNKNSKLASFGVVSVFSWGQLMSMKVPGELMRRGFRSINNFSFTCAFFFCAGLVPRIVKVAPACAITISSYEMGKRFFQQHNSQYYWLLEISQKKKHPYSF